MELKKHFSTASRFVSSFRFGINLDQCIWTNYNSRKVVTEVVLSIGGFKIRELPVCMPISWSNFFPFDAVFE